MLFLFSILNRLNQIVILPCLNSSKVLSLFSLTYVSYYFGSFFVPYYDPDNLIKLKSLFSLPFTIWTDWTISLFITWGIWKRFDWVWWLSLFWSFYELLNWIFLTLSLRSPHYFPVIPTLLWLGFLLILLLPWTRKQCTN